ncbi:MAG TPA: sigma-70 family RNA polymerase sigma factor [Anaerolineales bacterium]|nr:sigma-70 family RNA polymerase sigma factor [Anaerolineales bacterium]
MVLSSNPLTNILGGRAPLPLLKHEEEIRFARRIAAGKLAQKKLARKGLTAAERRTLNLKIAEAESAREALVLHNLPLVMSVAGRFRHSNLDYDDLIQEGVTGLIKAAERYDPKRGTRFGTLAVWWIRQAIGRAIANTGRTVRLPVNRGWKVGQLRRISAELAQQLGDEPPLAEVASRAGVTVQAATELLRDGQPTISLDAPPDDPDERSVMERVSDVTAEDPEAVVINEGLQRILEDALGRLEHREAEILRLRFGLGGGETKPLRMIANEWRMSPEGVRQISQRAMSHLRSMPQVRDLEAYLQE